MNEFKERLEAKKRELREERAKQAGTTATNFISKHRYTIMAVAGVLTGVVIGYHIRKDEYAEYASMVKEFRKAYKNNEACIAVQAGRGGAWYDTYHMADFDAKIFVFPTLEGLNAKDIDPDQVNKVCSAIADDWSANYKINHNGKNLD